MLGVGIDLIEKSRFAGWLQRPGLRRRFAPAELAYAESFRREQRQNEALAAAFAAKEAFYKAAAGLLGEQAEAGLLWAAWVEHEPGGRPRLRVDEPWGERLRRLGAAEFLLSISHDRSQAAAVVLICGEGEGGAEALARLIPPGFASLYGAGANDENNNEKDENDEEDQDGVWQVDGQRAAAWLPRRAREAHKGDFGHVVVAGGSSRYTGAPQMTAEAALRGGAGLVTLAAPRHICPLSPEVMRLPLPTAGGCLQSGALAPLTSELAKPGRTLALGMGLGRLPETCLLVRRLAALPVYKVVDADGLYALAEMAAEGKRLELPYGTVLTPHAGEMGRLLDCPAAAVEADRLGAVRRCAAKYGAVVVLKGARTLVAGAPELYGERVYANTTGNPGMATGGSGDVLAGLIAAWLAQGLEPMRAAALGVYIHGLAGDLAAAEMSEYALAATDITAHLGAAYRRLLEAGQAR